MFYDGEVQPHCLSRGFPGKEELEELGQLINPEAIKGLMKEKDYDKFESELEKRAHTFLSHSVKGDLSRFTGPNGKLVLIETLISLEKYADSDLDPVFFLHHVNLDRLWYQWQQLAPGKGLNAYNGKASNHSEIAAALTDSLDMGGLSRNLQVVDVMDVNGGEYCYIY